MEFEARGRYVRLPAEVRAEGDGILRVEGYAAVFNEEADIGGYFRERIAPGAFRSAIGRDDTVFLFNHDLDTVMARTRSGTLTLAEDDHGLRMSAELDETDPDVARIAPKMRRGDLDKMSFAFIAQRQEWDDSGEVPLRTIHEASLHDVSVVTTPAYDGTQIGLRSLADARKAQRAHNYNRTLMRKRLMGAELSRRGA